MDVLWRLGEATVREEHAELAGSREIAYTTVMTTMARLARKGILSRDTADLAHRYRPLVSRDQYARAVCSVSYPGLFWPLRKDLSEELLREGLAVIYR